MENKYKVHNVSVHKNKGWELCPHTGYVIGHNKCTDCEHNKRIASIGSVENESVSVRVVCGHPDVDKDYSSPYADLFPDLSTGVYCGSELFLPTHGMVMVLQVNSSEKEVGIEGKPIAVAVPRNDMRAGVTMYKSIGARVLDNGTRVAKYIVEEKLEKGMLADFTTIHKYYMHDGREWPGDTHPSIFISEKQHKEYWDAVRKRNKENEQR